jgi:hypothetical protein
MDKETGDRNQESVKTDAGTYRTPPVGNSTKNGEIAEIGRTTIL